MAPRPISRWRSPPPTERSSPTMRGAAPSASRPSCCRGCWACWVTAPCTMQPPSPWAPARDRSPACGRRWRWQRDWHSACTCRSSGSRASPPGSTPIRTRPLRSPAPALAMPICFDVVPRPRRSSTATPCPTSGAWWPPVSWRLHSGWRMPGAHGVHGASLARLPNAFRRSPTGTTCGPSSRCTCVRRAGSPKRARSRCGGSGRARGGGPDAPR